MSSFEYLIGSALLGSDADRDLSLVRVAVKSAVISRITCRCGAVLDQSDAVLFSDGSQAGRHGRSLAVVCPSCFDRCGADEIRRAAAASRLGLFACTWNGETQLGGEV